MVSGSTSKCVITGVERASLNRTSHLYWWEPISRTDRERNSYICQRNVCIFLFILYIYYDPQMIILYPHSRAGWIQLYIKCLKYLQVTLQLRDSSLYSLHYRIGHLIFTNVNVKQLFSYFTVKLAIFAE